MVNMGVITTGTKRDGSPKCGYFHRSFFLEFFVGKVRQKIKVIVEVGFGEHVFCFQPKRIFSFAFSRFFLPSITYNLGEWNMIICPTFVKSPIFGGIKCDNLSYICSLFVKSPGLEPPVSFAWVSTLVWDNLSQPRHHQHLKLWDNSTRPKKSKIIFNLKMPRFASVPGNSADQATD